MIKIMASIGFSILFELFIFGVAMNKAYDKNIEVILVCIFLVSVSIRLQLCGLGMGSMLSPILIKDIEKDNAGEKIDREPYEKMMKSFLQKYAKFSLLGLIYFGILFSL